MQNIIEILKSQGIEVAEDKVEGLNKAVAANYKTIAEFDKRVQQAEGERDNYKTQFETAQATLKGFDGVDVEAMKKSIAEYDDKIKKVEDGYKKQIADRDYADALNTAMSGYAFTSNAAKSAVMAEIKAAGLKMEDGKIIGLNDVIDSIKAKDAGAFRTEEAENTAKFTEKKAEERKLDDWDARIAKYKNMIKK